MTKRLSQKPTNENEEEIARKPTEYEGKVANKEALGQELILEPGIPRQLHRCEIPLRTTQERLRRKSDFIASYSRLISRRPTPLLVCPLRHFVRLHVQRLGAHIHGYLHECVCRFFRLYTLPFSPRL